MKNTGLVVLFSGLIACSSFGLDICIDGEQTNGVPLWSIRDRPVSRTELNSVLKRLGAAAPEQLILVRPSTNATAAALVSIINELQKAGFRNVSLYSPGEEDNLKGHYLVNITTGKQVIQSEEGIVLKTGFVADPELMEQPPQQVRPIPTTAQEANQPTK